MSPGLVKRSQASRQAINVFRTRYKHLDVQSFPDEMQLVVERYNSRCTIAHLVESSKVQLDHVVTMTAQRKGTVAATDRHKARQSFHVCAFERNE